MKKTFPLLVLFIFFHSLSAIAQEDVCCVLSKASGNDVSTSAIPMSGLECMPGKTKDEQKICQSKSDPQNTCSLVSEKERCSICGYHWNGKSCMTEDPVKKAKKILEKEMKEKAEAAEAALQK